MRGQRMTVWLAVDWANLDYTQSPLKTLFVLNGCACVKSMAQRCKSVTTLMVRAKPD
jgi:hypothetical protein